MRKHLCIACMIQIAKAGIITWSKNTTNNTQVEHTQIYFKDDQDCSQHSHKPKRVGGRKICYKISESQLLFCEGLSFSEN